MRKASLFFWLIFLFIACEKATLPKPHGQLRLEYPKAKYDLFKSNCGFDFEHSIFAELRQKKYPCWYNLFYPDLNATIYLSYRPVQNNFEILMADAEERVYKHAIRASFIKERSFSHPEKKFTENSMNWVAKAPQTLSLCLPTAQNIFYLALYISMPSPTKIPYDQRLTISRGI